jgi:hypothetical protein
MTLEMDLTRRVRGEEIAEKTAQERIEELLGPLLAERDQLLAERADIQAEARAKLAEIARRAVVRRRGRDRGRPPHGSSTCALRLCDGRAQLREPRVRVLVDATRAPLSAHDLRRRVVTGVVFFCAATTPLLARG